MHAYLIIAHNEFEVLQKLVGALDDPRNDIYIHFDKKVSELPHLEVKYSNLYICRKRIALGRYIPAEGGICTLGRGIQAGEVHLLPYDQRDTFPIKIPKRPAWFLRFH